jgi:hypothetical protein
MTGSVEEAEAVFRGAQPLRRLGILRFQQPVERALEKDFVIFNTLCLIRSHYVAFCLIMSQIV